MSGPHRRSAVGPCASLGRCSWFRMVRPRIHFAGEAGQGCNCLNGGLGHRPVGSMSFWSAIFSAPCAIRESLRASVSPEVCTTCLRDGFDLLFISFWPDNQREAASAEDAVRLADILSSDQAGPYLLDWPTLGALPSSCAISRWCLSVGSVFPAQSFSSELSPPFA